MIEVRNLSYAYSKKGPKVLDCVSLGLENGQIGVLLGPNGVGKSTLIRCVAGLSKAREGLVLIDGEELCHYMIEYGVGVSVKQVYEVKRIDSDYFEE